MNKNSLVQKMVIFMAITVFLGCNNVASNQPVRSHVVKRFHGVNDTSPTGYDPYPDSCILSVQLIPQQAPQWCWAACGEMCMEFLNNDGVKICQCDMANKIFRQGGITDGGNSCTGADAKSGAYLPDIPSAYNRTAWPDFKDYGYTAQSTREITGRDSSGGLLSNGQSYLSFRDLETQIFCEKKPVIFTWVWTSGGHVGQAHLMVAYGYAVDDTMGKWVYVHDPAQTYTILPYSKYVSDNDHIHYTDFYNITKL